MALLFLKAWWKEIAIALIVGGGIWYVNHLQNTVDKQKQQLVVQAAQNKVLIENDQVLQNAINATNKSFEAIDKIDKNNKEQFAKLQTVVNSTNTTISKRLAAILVEKKPQNCDQTIQYLIDAAKGYSK